MIYILTIIAILLGVISPFLKKILLKKLSSEELFFLTAIITGLLAFLLFIYKNMKGDISWNIFKKPFTFDIKYLLFFIGAISVSLITRKLWPMIYSSKIDISHIVSNSIPLEIILTALIGYFIFEEKITYHTIGGIFLIVAGLAMMNYGKFIKNKK